MWLSVLLKCPILNTNGCHLCLGMKFKKICEIGPTFCEHQLPNVSPDCNIPFHFHENYYIDYFLEITGQLQINKKINTNLIRILQGYVLRKYKTGSDLPSSTTTATFSRFLNNLISQLGRCGTSDWLKYTLR